MTIKNQSENELAQPLAQKSENHKPDVDPEAVQGAIDRLVIAVQSATKEGIQHGVFHLPASEHDALWMACNVIQKSGAFPQYQFTFYHQGMGEGTNTCAVAFLNSPKLDQEIN